MRARPISNVTVVVALASLVGCGGAGPSRTYEPPERSGDRADAPAFFLGGGAPQAPVSTEGDEGGGGGFVDETPFVAQTYEGEMGDVAMSSGATTRGAFSSDPGFTFTSAHVTAANPDGATQMAVFFASGRFGDLANAPSGVYRVRRDGQEPDVLPSDTQVDLDGTETILELVDSDYIDVMACSGPEATAIDFDVPATDIALEFEEPVTDEDTGDFTRRVTFDIVAYDETASNMIVGRATGSFTVDGRGQTAPVGDEDM